MIDENKKPEATKTLSVGNEGIKQEPKEEPIKYDATENNDSIPRKRGWYWLLAPDGSPSTRQIQPVGNENRTKKEEPDSPVKNQEDSSELDRGWHWLLTPDGNHFDIAAKKQKSHNGISINASSTGKTDFDSKPPRRRGAWHWLLAADGSPSTVDISLTVGFYGTRKQKRDVQSSARLVDSISKESEEDYDLPESDAEDSTTDDEAYDPSESDVKDYATDDNSIDGDHHRSISKGISPSVAPSNSYDEIWEKKFQLLVEYKQKHKTTRVPRKEPTLGVWVHAQRQTYKQKVLSKYRAQRLNSLGFVWSCEIAWMEMYNRLLFYKEQHNGSVHVPITSTKHRRLGLWLATQRRLYKRGKLRRNRIALLESIGFRWQLVELTPWMEMYERLLNYKKKHGTTCVPRGYKADRKLAQWVAMQRCRCKEKDRVDLLNKIGFEWKLLEHTPWMEMYERLLNYKKKHGTTCVPKGYKVDPKLGIWVSAQRYRCKEKDRINLLNQIGFVWDASGRNQYNSW